MSEHFVIKNIRRSIKEAKSRKGMIVGLPEIRIAASHAEVLLREIDRLKAELEELQSAYDELRLLADGRLSIKPEYVRGLERQLAEARAEVRQVEQSAINFHEAWQQALNDLESARSALLEIAKIRLEPGHCYEQSVRMQEIAKTVLRRGE